MTVALVTRPCMTDGCEQVAVCRNLCGYHYDRSRRDGTVDQHPKMRGETATLTPAYVTIHMRLRKTKGPASGYTCTDCGAPARDWTFDDDLTRPDTMWCPVTGMAYSANLDRYRPRCRACHFTFDGRRKYPPVCTVSGCTADHKSRGWCGAHERRHRRYGSPEFRWITKAEKARLDLP